MIARRTGILLGCQKLGKVRLLRRCQVEAQRERLKLCALRREAHVRRKLYPSGDGALHGYSASAYGSDAVLYCRTGRRRKHGQKQTHGEEETRH